MYYSWITIATCLQLTFATTWSMGHCSHSCVTDHQTFSREGCLYSGHGVIFSQAGLGIGGLGGLPAPVEYV